MSRGPLRVASFFLGLALVLGLSTVTRAQDTRLVVVNGDVLDQAELFVMDSLNCGFPVPNGAYWINLRSGTWGRVGSAGMSLPNCEAVQAARASSQRAYQAPTSSGGSSAEIGRYQTAIDHVSTTWGTSYVDPVR